MFALYYDAITKQVHGINASGRGPRDARFNSRDIFKSIGPNHWKIPRESGLAVTVPGIPLGWEDALKSWGTMSLDQVLTPAIEMATQGFPVQSIAAHWWKTYAQKQLEAQSSFTPAPTRAGQICKNPDLAQTLTTLCKRGARDGFYRNEIAHDICKAVQAKGGLLAMEDLEAHVSEFVKPVKQRYRGLIDVYECPPNGQGVVALAALDTFQNLVGGACNFERGSAEHLHSMIECLRSSFADAQQNIADPHFTKSVADDLLSTKFLQKRLGRIHRTKKTFYEFDTPTRSSDTVSFQVVDKMGNAISVVNSTFEGFGTGICPPGRGISLQNRASNFSLDETSKNAAQPNKRPYHTIIPGMSLYAADDSLHTSFSNMGAFMQPQGHFQLISNLIDWKDHPQAAVDYPRFCLVGVDHPRSGAGGLQVEVALEDFPGSGWEVSKLESNLAKMGHSKIKQVRGFDRALFGRAQIILRDFESGVLFGGSDPRADGYPVPGG